MVKESKMTEIRFKLFYSMSDMGEVMKVILTRCPEFGENIKWRLVGDSRYCTFKELSDIISKRTFKKGQPLKFFIIDEKTGKKEGIGIDFSKGWPSFIGNKIIERINNSIDISDQMEKLGLL